MPDAYKKLRESYKSGMAETSGLGAELRAKSEMARAARGGSAAPAEPPKATPTLPVDKTGADRYGSRSGEQRIDTSAMTKPLGSYKKGVDSVPETGIYKLHEGEKVVPEDENPDSHLKGEESMEHSPAEKAHFARSMHKLHGGALHRHLGIPEGEPIPMEKKQEAANSDNPHVAAMGRMAVAMHGWKHGKK